VGEELEEGAEGENSAHIQIAEEEIVGQASEAPTCKHDTIAV